jgi:mono/diheme cytochrome c family protein
MTRTFLYSALLAIILAMTGARAEDNTLERGRYLVTTLGACGTCHTTRDASFKPIPDMELAGGRVIDAVDIAGDPVGIHAIVPNITPDKQTGIGNWTDAQIIDAIRNGRRPDGTLIGPPMPVALYRSISDSDVRAIVAYLRQLKPVEHKVEKSTYSIPLPQNYGPVVTHVPDVPRSDKVAYGKYVAEVAHCWECHTPLLDGRADLGKPGAGGRRFNVSSGAVLSANLTPADPDGIAKWTDEQIKKAITQGVRPDGRALVPVMGFAWYKNISAEDLDALIAYLRSLKPAEPNE